MTPQRAAEFTPERRLAFNDWFLDELAWEIRMRREVLPEGMKRCITCHRVMPATGEYFYRHGNGKLFGECKVCRRLNMREYERTHYYKNREKYLAYFRQRNKQRRATA